MMDNGNDHVRATARERERECRIEIGAFKKRLGLLSWTNWITVVLPALLSTFAGGAVLSDLAASQTEIDWKTLTGAAALFSALLVAVHKARNCDPYQAECRRLVQAYEGLAVKYRTLHQVGVKDYVAKLSELDASLATVRETAAADVPESYRIAAARNLGTA